MAEKKEPTEETGLNPKWLDGLTFTGSTSKEVTENGVKKVRYTAFERPLDPGDVMSWKDYGSLVYIATKDGRKHAVTKKGK